MTERAIPLCPTLAFDAFFQNHLEPNLPCLFGPDLVHHWPARKDWTSDHLPNWTRFLDRYGSHMVQPDAGTTFSDIFESWNKGHLIYAKDWHLALQCLHMGKPAFYETPLVFQDDWMNSYYLTATSDDFRFVYAGKAGTFTPVHKDVYCSYSWSTNVAGRKRWWLFPPHTAHKLRQYPDRRTSPLVEDVRQVDCTVFPLFQEAMQDCLVVDQEAGETIFVPSGWHHQVLNLTDCISINHNWCNSNNIVTMYKALSDHVADVDTSLSDIKELMQSTCSDSDDDSWTKEYCNVCQTVLKADSGWDWLTFWSMVLHAIRGLRNTSLSARPPDKHVIYQVSTILNLMRQQHDAQIKHIDGLNQVLDDLDHMVK